MLKHHHFTPALLYVPVMYTAVAAAFQAWHFIPPIATASPFGLFPAFKFLNEKLVFSASLRGAIATWQSICVCYALVCGLPRYVPYGDLAMTRKAICVVMRDKVGNKKTQHLLRGVEFVLVVGLITWGTSSRVCSMLCREVR